MCTTRDVQRSYLQRAELSLTSVPAHMRRSAELIPAVYMLKICRCMRHRPQIPKYLIVLANEAAQYLSARNLQVPLIFPRVWCLVLTAGKRLVNRRAHLQFQGCLRSSDKTGTNPGTTPRHAGEACRGDTPARQRSWCRLQAQLLCPYKDHETHLPDSWLVLKLPLATLIS